VAIDQAKVEAFLGRALGDASAANLGALCHVGDRLGLFKELAGRGPATVDDLARRAAIDPRYAREWLSAMASAGYVAYDPASGVFTLPPEHAPVLAQEGGPYFFGGVYQMLPALVGVVDPLAEAFRTGGGVPQSAYSDHFWDGLERFTAAWFENLLLPVWVPAMPDVQAKLEQGCDWADVGCGRGRAAITLAQAYPTSRFVGFDAFEPTIARANANATAAGVADRVRFEHADASKGVPGQWVAEETYAAEAAYDVVSTFDVIHDAVDPLGLLRAIRAALKPDGVYMLLDINSSHRLEENAGPLGAFFYSVSTLYCMTTSLAHGGAGLGTCGLHEPKVRELCAAAGFSDVRRVPLENPFNILYEVRP
jgi:SAM-dependent methyltransferase